MEQFLAIILTTTFAHSVLRISTPIIFGSMAAVVSDRAGVPNIGIEGMMLSAALAGVLLSAATQSVIIGLFGAVAVSMMLSMVLAYFSLTLKTHNILSGIAINLIAKGGTVFVLFLATGDKGSSGKLKSLTVPTVDIPVIKDIPIIGEIFSGHNLLTYVAFINVILFSIFINRTSLGLRIRAVGENEGAVRSVGVNVVKTRYVALLISGMLAGFAGAFMSMGYVSWFSRDMTNGRGFISLAAEAMGRGKPWTTLLAALVFGGADALSNSLQILRIPAQFIQMIPYVVTIIGIVIYSISYTSKLRKKRE